MAETINLREILAHCDHTLLAQTATWEEIRQICDDGMTYHVASVCIPPYFVKQAKDYVGDRLKICTVVGFPNGYQTTMTKLIETQEALDNGADEIDMVIRVGALKERKDEEIRKEIRLLKAACGPDRILKVIIETCLLTDDEIIRMCGIVTDAGADFIKTSTGFSKAGATFEGVKLMVEHVGPGVQVKAAGGISSLEDAERFLKLGATRLGTSRIVKIAKNQQEG